jgi:hypothetical protein
MQALYDEITTISDTFCREHLNDEYAELARKMTATLAKRPRRWSTVGQMAGRRASRTRWDRSIFCSTNPSLRTCADELRKRISVSQQTASGRPKIRERWKFSRCI